MRGLGNEKPQIYCVRDHNVKNLKMTEHRRYYLMFQKWSCCNRYSGIYKITCKASQVRQLLQSVLANIFTCSVQVDGRQEWGKTCFRSSRAGYWPLSKTLQEEVWPKWSPWGDCTWFEPARISVKSTARCCMISSFVTAALTCKQSSSCLCALHIWYWKPVQHVTALLLN